MAGKEQTVLVMDDEQETLKYVGMNLKSRGYKVITARDGTEGLKLLEENIVDLILLDITMPGPDGFQVCKHIRQVSSVPIIMLSALGREQDKVAALDMGADDYLTKPFGVEELVARVRAALRRGQRYMRAGEKKYQFGNIEVDLSERSVFKEGKGVKLTPIEFSLLALLIQNAGKVLTHRAILQAVWGGEYGEEKEYVWAYIRRLRSKLEEDPDKPQFLLTEPYVGYRFQSLVQNHNSGK
jgi:two-component system KDP operon response regulator KdpE